MHLVQRDCVVCPPQIPDHCDPACGENEICSVVFQTCDACSTAVCTPIGGDTSTQSSGGSNIGAIVGGVVAGVVLVLIAIGFRWYRGRRALAAAAAHKRATFEPKPDVVASADTVLNRPDPNINIIIEKPESAIYASKSQLTFEDGSPVRFEPPENPFLDHASIATASDRATNVIPIGLITPSSASLASRTTGLTAISKDGSGSIASSAPSGFTLHPPSESPREFTFSQTQQPNTPVRPQRGPDIDMRLDPSRPLSTASQGGPLLPPKAPYAASARTGQSGISSRSSMLSTSSSFLNEAPQIVTPQQANFRQVLGVQRAAVVQLGSSPTTSTAPSVKSRGSSSTIGKSGSNPFNDGEETEKGDDVDMYKDGRPISSMSNAESIANIASAQRVQLIRPLNVNTSGSRPGEGRALLSPSPLSSSSTTYSPTITGRSISGSNSNASSPSATPRAVDFRTAGQLTPPSQAVPRSFDDMMGQGPPSFDDMGRPNSSHSFAMTNRTSTADSILESFPFVPPSPISMHHAQPHQPSMQQQQQQHLQAQNTSRMIGSRGPSSLRTESTQEVVGNNNKPGRMTLGLSTVSSASSGLGAFPFQFEGDAQRNHSSTIGPSPLRHPQGEEDEEDDDGGPIAESTIGHGDRASLDTLQLSRDLSEFPMPGNLGLGPRR